MARSTPSGSWPFGPSSRTDPGRQRKLQKALAYLALGEVDLDRLRELSGWDEGVSSLGDAMKPDGPLATAVYRYWAERAAAEDKASSELLAERLSALGLDRVIEDWKLDKEAVERLLAAHQTTHGVKEGSRPASREGMVLRFLLWSTDPSRTSDPNRSSTNARLLSNYFDRVFGLRGRLVEGDGIVAFGREPIVGLGGRPAPVVLTTWDERNRWTAPFPDAALGSPERALHVALRALGWRALFRKRLDEGRNVWNGRLARLFNTRLEDPDSSPKLWLDLQPTDYVASVATNFEFRSWGQYLGRLHREGSGWLINELEAQLDRWLSQSAAPGEDRSVFVREDVPQFRQLLDEFASTPTSEDVVNLGKGLIEREDQLLRESNLRDSQFANPLSVNMTYVTRDGYVLIQQRNKEKVGYGGVDWQTSAAGFVATPRDYKDDYPRTVYIDLWKAAENETAEELGAKVLPGSTMFLGVVREARHYEVGITGFGTLEGSLRNLRAAPKDESGAKSVRVVKVEPDGIAGWNRHSLERAIVLPGTDQATEVKDFDAVLAQPPAFFEFVRQHGYLPPSGEAWSSWMPLGAFSVLLMLAHEHGWDALADAWRKSGRR